MKSRIARPDAPTFKEDEIKVLGLIDKNPKLFKVMARGRECCLKIARFDMFEREVVMLAKMPPSPSLHQLIGLVGEGDGYMSQVLTPFVSGKSLACRFKAT